MDIAGSQSIDQAFSWTQPVTNLMIRHHKVQRAINTMLNQLECSYYFFNHNFLTHFMLFHCLRFLPNRFRLFNFSFFTFNTNPLTNQPMKNKDPPKLPNSSTLQFVFEQTSLQQLLYFLLSTGE